MSVKFLIFQIICINSFPDNPFTTGAILENCTKWTMTDDEFFSSLESNENYEDLSYNLDI